MASRKLQSLDDEVGLALGTGARTGELEPDQVPTGSQGLRATLVALDVVAVASAWYTSLVLVFGSQSWDRTLRQIAAVVLITALSMCLIASHRLYWARVCSVRAVETARLGRVAIFSGAFALPVGLVVNSQIRLAAALLGTLLAYVALLSVRGAYRSWLSAGRREGRYTRSVIIVGTGDEGLELRHLVSDHPELGFRVVGVVGSSGEYSARGFNTPLLGDIAEAPLVARQVGATGVLVAGSIPQVQLNRVVRTLLRAGLHVHISSGLRGIAHHRLRSMPLAHEPFFYVEQAKLSRWQLGVKRTLDGVVASVGLVLALPVLGAAALAVKVNDGGPVLFTQTRVGRGGKLFELCKLRTMVPDAESRLDELIDFNQRGGPLFKLRADPRVTAVGRVLRATSIDELPQLWNVLNGTMSLVGPRPALPREVEAFNEDLQARANVLPGITGLWQLEGRDNPSFAVYQRLDLFYVENWSVLLDLAILLGTFRAVLVRAFKVLQRSLRSRRGKSASAVLD